MNSQNMIGLGVYASLYILVVLGLYIIFSENITSLLKGTYYSRFRIKKKSKLISTQWFKYLKKLITITCENNSFITVYSFLIFTFLLFLIFFTLLVHRTSISFAFSVSIIFALAPYIYLRIKLNTIRIEGSYEANTIVSELINQYKINYTNMIEAIDSMVYVKEAPICRKVFYRLSIRLKEYQTGEELLLALDEMIFTIDTEWMRMVTNNIYMSIERGIDVTIGLEDILHELKEAKITTEKSKQINIESFSILKYLSPLMYIATILIAIKYFGFTLSKFIKYQFYTATGIKLFTLILFLMLINIIVMIIFQKRKYDL